MSKSLLPALALGLFAACSSSSTTTPAGPGTDAGVTGDAAPSDVVTLSMKLTIKEGEEVHRCQLVQLPKGDLWTNGIEHHYTKGSHHFLMYATTIKSIPAGEEGQTECPNGDEGPFKYSGPLIYASQTSDGKLEFPAGVGMHLESEQVFLIQSHYINATKVPIDATVSVSFKKTTAEQVQVRAAPFIFFNPFIYLAPKATGKSMVQSCGIPADITVLTGFSHYHQRGTKLTLWRDPNATTQSNDVVYSSADWENPPTLAKIDLKKGEQLRFQCEYDNTASDTEIIQGPRAATNEMCAMVGIYYPAQEDKPGPEKEFWQCGYDRTFTELGTKNSCIPLAQCLQGCPAGDAPRFYPGGVEIGVCWQRCLADACPGGLNRVFPLSRCQQTQCASECSSPDACIGCLTTKCANEFNSCSAHTCAAN